MFITYRTELLNANWLRRGGGGSIFFFNFLSVEGNVFSLDWPSGKITRF